MQSFAEFMAESFHSNTRLLWNYPSRSQATAKFTIDAIQVTVTFEQRDPNGPWHILFEVDQGGRTDIAHSSFAIFNGVFQAVEEFLSVRQPETVVIATKRDELARIYQTYLRRESQAIQQLGYQLEGPIQLDPYQEFFLRRTTPSAWRQ